MFSLLILLLKYNYRLYINVHSIIDKTQMKRQETPVSPGISPRNFSLSFIIHSAGMNQIFIMATTCLLLKHRMYPE